MWVLPALRAVAGELKLPAMSAIVPVGVGLLPLKAIVTTSVCAVVMLVDEGVNVTTGVVFAGFVTMTGRLTAAEIFPVAASMAVTVAA
jgi:hypothetical protein